MPLAFLLFLTGCAAYLKSFLPTKMEAREAQQASKHDDADQSDPPSDDVVATAAEEEVQEDTKSAERNTGSSDKVVPIRIAYDNPDNPTYGSSAIEAAPSFSLRAATGPIGEPTRTSNDNRSSAPSGSPVSGSGGGGGGGGGGAAVAATTGRHLSASRIHPLSRRRIPFATGRRGPMDRCTCRTWSVARYLSFPWRLCWPAPPIRMVTG